MNLQEKYPLVSIVTPSFNQGSFIEQTLLSVLGQDYPNIEYIVVDGGSTDNTIEVLRKYEGRLRWISEKDRGTEDAINKGFLMSRGAILAWLASDDTYLPGTISKVIDFFTCHPHVKMVYGKAHYVDKDGNIIGDYPTAPFHYKSFAVYNVICQPSVFFVRDAFFDTGGLSLDLQYGTDYDLWIRIAQNYRIVYLSEFFSTYRLHGKSKTMTDTLVRFQECLEITMKYYHWAPANRVYPYCYYLLKSRLPSFFRRFNMLVKFLAIIFSVVNYLKLNKRIRLDDIKLLPRNVKKFFVGWELKDIHGDSLKDS